MKSGNWFGNLFMYIICVWLMNIMTPLTTLFAIFGGWQIGHDWIRGRVYMAGFREIVPKIFNAKYNTYV